MALPLKLPWETAQTRWKSQLEPIIANPILAGHQLDAIQFVANTPQTINHMLSRTPQGFFPVLMSGPANLWVTQPLNDSTLTLETDADVLVSIWVY